MAQQTAVRQIISDIKEYARSLDVPSNLIYKDNEMLILSCFMKAVEICENKLVMEKEQIIEAYHEGEYISNNKINAEQYYNETYNK